MGRAHQLSQRIRKRFGVLARARHDEDVRAKLVRHVNSALPRRFRQLRLFDRADNADNGEESCVIGFGALKQALAQRLAVGPVTPGEVFVHHTDSIVRIC